jgi:hypothetical protein
LLVLEYLNATQTTAPYSNIQKCCSGMDGDANT